MPPQGATGDRASAGVRATARWPRIFSTADFLVTVAGEGRPTERAKAAIMSRSQQRHR
jgi:hypothetical protein